MTLGRLLLRNLFYHWRGNSAVLLGVVVGTAVLTGALLVGDSLRGSLREQALGQLGWVDNALVAKRFIRQESADKLDADRISLAIMVRGTATTSTNAGSETQHATLPRGAGRVTILGVDDKFWSDAMGVSSPSGRLIDGGDSLWSSTRAEGVVNDTLAEQL